MDIFLISIIVFLAPAVFCVALLDLSLRSVNYPKLSSVHRHENEKARKLFELLSSPERAISVLLFLRYVLNAILYLLLGTLIITAPWSLALKLASAITGLILLEYVPRMLAVQNPEGIAFAFLKPFEFVLKASRILPFSRTFERTASLLLRLWGFNVDKIFSEYSVNEITMFLSLRRTKEGTELRKQTIDFRFLDFSGRRVREVMVPRPFVKAAEVHTTLPALLNLVRDHGYSRIPVYRTSFDNILGILHIKDVIGISDAFQLEKHLRKPFFIPETATVQAAFQNMRRNRAHLAIVVDEYGGVDGIVTLEDLIEELMGEIQDEYDVEVQLYHKTTDGTWLLEGNFPVKELNQNIGVDLPEDPRYTTVAGFLLSILDKIPAEKEEIQYGKLLFRIEKMMGSKIAKISLKTPPSVKGKESSNV